MGSEPVLFGVGFRKTKDGDDVAFNEFVKISLCREKKTVVIDYNPTENDRHLDIYINGECVKGLVGFEWDGRMKLDEDTKEFRMSVATDSIAIESSDLLVCADANNAQVCYKPGVLASVKVIQGPYHVIFEKTE